MSDEASSVVVNKSEYTCTGLMIPSLHSSIVEDKFIRNTLNIDDIEGTKSRPRTRVLNVPKEETVLPRKGLIREVRVHTDSKDGHNKIRKEIVRTGVASALYDENYSIMNKTLPQTLPFSLYSVDTSAKKTHEVRPSSSDQKEQPCRLTDDRRVHGCGLKNQNVQSEYARTAREDTVPRLGRRNADVGWRGEKTAELLHSGLYKDVPVTPSTYHNTANTTIKINADVITMQKHPEQYPAAGCKSVGTEQSSKHKGVGLMMQWHDRLQKDDHILTIKEEEKSIGKPYTHTNITNFKKNTNNISNIDQDTNNTNDNNNSKNDIVNQQTYPGYYPAYYTKTKLYQQHRVGPGSQKTNSIVYKTDSLSREYGTLGTSAIDNNAITNSEHNPTIRATPYAYQDTSPIQRCHANINKYQQEALRRQTNNNLQKSIKHNPTQFTHTQPSKPINQVNLVKTSVCKINNVENKTLVLNLPNY